MRKFESLILLAKKEVTYDYVASLFDQIFATFWCERLGRKCLIYEDLKE